jgi:hypothetical protein
MAAKTGHEAADTRKESEMAETRLFDLNIEKILEAWDTCHAVRELIANALDEQILSSTQDVSITKSDRVWVIRDWGRGLRYEHFTQNESVEKLKNVGKVIGKFGVGLKDALATLDRNHVAVEIESRHGIITLAQQAKHGFQDVVTLHAAVTPPRDPEFVGTAIRLTGIADKDMDTAKSFFLRFSGEEILEETSVGRILAKKGRTARIYVAGLLVATEDNFAFSYDVTSLTAAMTKALNRERTNVGRTAYADRIKSMLLHTTTPAVAKVLAKELVAIERGTNADEVDWKEVAVHACKILNASGKYVFVTAYQISENPSSIDHAKSDGYQIVTVPDNIYRSIQGESDLTGAPVRDLGVYQAEWNTSFTFDFIDPSKLSKTEREVFDLLPKIVALAGGMPRKVKEVKISRTMRVDFATGEDAVGLWDENTKSIVIKRDQLKSLHAFAGTVLHEITHAKTGFDDVTRDFENALTELLGIVSTVAVEVQAMRKGLLAKLLS